MITGENVWELVKNDREFIGTVPQEIWEAYRKFVIKLPEIFEKANLLEQTAWFENVLKAELAFAQYKIDNGFAKVMTESSPVEMLPLRERKGFMAKMQKNMIDYIPLLKEEIQRIENSRKTNNPPWAIKCREDNQKLRLRGKALMAFLCGDLTIGKLLELQPAVFVAPK